MPSDLDPVHTATAATRVAADRGRTGRVELLRAGMNHVFRIGEVVLRVAPASLDGQAHVELARWLLDAGLPAVRPLDDAATVDDLVVTSWEHVRQPPGAAVDYEQLGAVIARVHRLPPEQLPPRVPLPWCGEAGWLQLEAVYERAAAADVVGETDLAVLARECEALADWQEQARAEPVVVCHGDVHPQNVLMRDDGELVLLDWDGLCLGPAAWDHAALLTWEERWDGSPGTYAAFADGYGADLRTSAVARRLARVRLLAPTLNMIVRAATDPELAREARRRMRYWRGEPDPPPWRAQ